ncbi:MAG: NUDIX domain-containing protein [Parcubacteria group bacterium]|jgi:ADP-ribose pyrophosphatase YjhB (NUDIX family)
MKKLRPGHDYIGVGGGILIFNKKKELLLIKRGKNQKNETGFWQKPGGEVDYGEKVIASMKREVKEEAGITVDVWGYLPHTDHIIKKENQHWVAFNYLANLKSGTAKVMEPHKHDAVEWFSLNNLPRKINQTTRESVRNYLAGKYIKIK